MRAGALGDLVLTLPVLERLAPVDVACAPRYAPLLPPGARRVDGDWIWTAARPPHPYAEAFAFSPTAARCLREAGVPIVREIAPRPPAGTHATVHFARGCGLDAPACGLDGGWLRPRVRAVADGSVAGRPVVIAPGSGGAEKRWPLARWLAVAEALRGVPVVWVAGPVEEGEPGWPPETLRPGLPGLVALAAACGAWLGPDSGPSHLAAAAGAPVIAVFGPTDPECWAPVGAQVAPWDTSAASMAASARRAREALLAADLPARIG